MSAFRQEVHCSNFVSKKPQNLLYSFFFRPSWNFLEQVDTWYHLPNWKVVKKVNFDPCLSAIGWPMSRLKVLQEFFYWWYILHFKSYFNAWYLAFNVKCFEMCYFECKNKFNPFILWLQHTNLRATLYINMRSLVTVQILQNWKRLFIIFFSNLTVSVSQKLGLKHVFQKHMTTSMVIIKYLIAESYTEKVE